MTLLKSTLKISPVGGLSYAQFGEDRLLLEYLDSAPSKFYVDIGCNHPIKHSNTYLLYQIGWTGLCVDANETLLDEFRKERPNDTVECACVGDVPGEVTFVISRDSLLSHVADATIVHPRATDEAQRVTLPVKTLEQLFTEHSVPHEFGLLSIDVEGVDFAALRSFDIRKWRPYVILIEIHDLDLGNCDNHEVVAYLRDARYKLVGYNRFSALFVANDHAKASDASPT